LDQKSHTLVAEFEKNLKDGKAEVERELAKN
jgi:hypothetical protein